VSAVRVHGCKGVAESEKAVLVECDDFDGPIWVPKSQIDDDSDVYAKDTDGTLVITEWFATKKGLG
jgi:hypothetical protein